MLLNTTKEVEARINARERQDPLRKRYKVAHDEAKISDHAKTNSDCDGDPFHGWVTLGSQAYGAEYPFGIHHAVGGYHDAPNPGDILCAALAACFDSTLRIIADRFGVKFIKLEVGVWADADVRGTLMVDTSVPVGFQTMRCQISVELVEGTPHMMVEKFIEAAEQCCVVLQTLKAGVPIETSVSIEEQ